MNFLDLLTDEVLVFIFTCFFIINIILIFLQNNLFFSKKYLIYILNHIFVIIGSFINLVIIFLISFSLAIGPTALNNPPNWLNGVNETIGTCMWIMVIYYVLNIIYLIYKIIMFKLKKEVDNNK